VAGADHDDVKIERELCHVLQYTGRTRRGERQAKQSEPGA